MSDLLQKYTDADLSLLTGNERPVILICAGAIRDPYRTWVMRSVKAAQESHPQFDFGLVEGGSINAMLSHFGITIEPSVAAVYQGKLIAFDALTLSSIPIQPIADSVARCLNSEDRESQLEKMNEEARDKAGGLQRSAIADAAVEKWGHVFGSGSLAGFAAAFLVHHFYGLQEHALFVDLMWQVNPASGVLPGATAFALIFVYGVTRRFSIVQYILALITMVVMGAVVLDNFKW
jgi:hypothetical protein